MCVYVFNAVWLLGIIILNMLNVYFRNKKQNDFISCFNDYEYKTTKYTDLSRFYTHKYGV